ncbi:unnamed protein product [Caenorhabditis auriculariae]|uniref:t-SNARE coiled-coil homology domain-containing protein n=1 Tax=Caenorhabditis auriculariae TaxID=2777116 RepID=A0A8S1HS92_9PELO|nr:unnamed protein product [Caenorhabditis auriculariae]
MVNKKVSIATMPDPVVLPTSEEATRRLKIKMIDLDTEITKYNLQALDSSRKMVIELETINEEGFHTLAALEEQDEQLDKIEENLTRVNADLNVVSRNIHNMEEFCGCGFKTLLCYPFRCLRKNKRNVAKEEVLQSMKSTSGGEVAVTFRPSKRRESAGDFMKRLTSDTIEDELEKNLIQIDQSLESIKHLAVDMHVQLKIQEPKLERIEKMAEINDDVVDGVNERVRKLL